MLLKDRLGSVDAIIDSATNTLVDSRGYDAFGKPRNGNWSDAAPARLSVFGFSITPKGFTKHEHLNAVELIHMNGRAYDYHLGRFLSVDPFIQSPTNSQSLNPYSYIMNNPLAGTDPTGYRSISPKINCFGMYVGPSCPDPMRTPSMDFGVGVPANTTKGQAGNLMQTLSRSRSGGSNGAARFSTGPQKEERERAPSEIGDPKESKPMPEVGPVAPTHAQKLYQMVPENGLLGPVLSKPGLEAIGGAVSVIESFFKSNDYGQPMGQNPFTREITEGADAKYAQIGLALDGAAAYWTGGANVLLKRMFKAEVSSAGVAAMRGSVGSGLNAANEITAAEIREINKALGNP